MKSNLLVGRNWSIYYSSKRELNKLIKEVNRQAESHTLERCGNIPKTQRDYKNWFVYFDAYFDALLNYLNVNNFQAVTGYGVVELTTRDEKGVKTTNKA